MKRWPIIPVHEWQLVIGRPDLLSRLIFVRARLLDVRLSYPPVSGPVVLAATLIYRTSDRQAISSLGTSLFYRIGALMLSLPLAAIRYVFLTLLVVSTVLVTLLLAVYWWTQRNVLLRSCCLVLISIAFTIFICLPFYGQVMYQHFGLCFAQAVILSYFFTCVQAHLSFLMVNNCCLAMGWRLAWLESSFSRTWTFLATSYIIPLFPTVVAASASQDAEIMASGWLKTQPLPFFCILRSFWLTTFLNYCFLVPGLVSCLLLVHRTLTIRAAAMDMSRTTQITNAYIIRLYLSTTVYSFFAIFSCIPPDLLLPHALANSLQPQVQTPDLISFIPAVMGIGLFLMYGFGTPARTVYRDIRKQVNHRLMVIREKGWISRKDTILVPMTEAYVPPSQTNELFRGRMLEPRPYLAVELASPDPIVIFPPVRRNSAPIEYIPSSLIQIMGTPQSVRLPIWED